MSEQKQGDLLAGASASPTPPASPPAAASPVTPAGSTSAVSDVDLSIGQTLARWREKRGESVSTVAARLRCDTAVIEALESDRFNDLGAPVFARGHLKRYAELLGAPVDNLLERWSVVQRQSVAQPDLTSMPRTRTRSVDTRVWGRRFGAAAVALVIGLAAWWILKGSGTAKTTPEQLAAQALPPPPPAPAPLPVAPPPAAADAATVEPVASEVVTPIAGATPAAVTAPIAASAPPVVGERARLRLAAREDSWVQVVDATGRRLYFGTLRRDNSVSINGAAPLRVLLGRADATSVELAGRPVTVPSSIIFNATAHFTIDATGQVQRVVAPVQP